MRTQPSFEAIHHLKFPVSELNRALDFYERALGARRLADLDHIRDGKLFAYILEVPNLGTVLELRLDPERARSHIGFDPVTLAVARRGDLEAWILHFDASGIPHSPVLVGLFGWVIVFEDPDGRRIRLYTNERHGPEIAPTSDSPWL